jgi:REP element-mobilizing transposase RayT
MNQLNFRKQIRLVHDAYNQGNVFHVTIVTHEKYAWFGLYPELADIAVEHLRIIAEERAAQLFAWCIMPDHAHVLLQDNTIIEFVRLFKGRMNPRARTFEKGRLLWQRSFYDHGLRKDEAVNDSAIYIWQNPVRAGLMERPEDYRWSGSFIWQSWKEFF